MSERTINVSWRKAGAVFQCTHAKSSGNFRVSHVDVPGDTAISHFRVSQGVNVAQGRDVVYFFVVRENTHGAEPTFRVDALKVQEGYFLTSDKVLFVVQK